MRCKICGDEISGKGPRAFSRVFSAIEDASGNIPDAINHFCDECFSEMIKWHGRRNGCYYSIDLFSAKPRSFPLTEDCVAMFVAHKISLAAKRIGGGRPYDRCACKSPYGRRCCRIAEDVINGIPVCKQHKPIFIEGRASVVNAGESLVVKKAKEILSAVNQ